MFFGIPNHLAPALTPPFPDMWCQWIPFEKGSNNGWINIMRQLFYNLIFLYISHAVKLCSVWADVHKDSNVTFKA